MWLVNESLPRFRFLESQRRSDHFQVQTWCTNVSNPCLFSVPLCTLGSQIEPVFLGSSGDRSVISSTVKVRNRQHTFTWSSMSRAHSHAQCLPAGHHTEDLFCEKSHLTVFRHLLSVSRHSLFLLFLPSFALRLKDSISHLGIPLMPLLLFLKILPPNQIYQLAPAFLLFSSCVSEVL